MLLAYDIHIHRGRPKIHKYLRSPKKHTTAYFSCSFTKYTLIYIMCSDETVLEANVYSLPGYRGLKQTNGVSSSAALR